MNVREKRRQELNLQIQNRKEEIIDAAIRCFKDKGIDCTKILDIAKEAEVGESTIYRYFDTKVGLVIDCAVKVWNTGMTYLVLEAGSECQKETDGFSKLAGIFRLIGSVYEKRPYLLSLLEQFDNYIVKEKVSTEQLAEFENGISCIYSHAMQVIHEGWEDGTIRTGFDESIFYLSSAHAILSLSQKLLLRGNVLESDRKENHKAEIETLITALLSYVKADGKQFDNNVEPL